MAERDTEAPAEREREVVTGDEGFDKMPRRTYQRRRPRQVIPDYIDWKDVDYLRQFIPERGKIMPRRISGVTAKDQRRIATAIKRARSMALLPFVWE
jgi:small subunit ribosomal protein S18